MEPRIKKIKLSTILLLTVAFPTFNVLYMLSCRSAYKLSDLYEHSVLLLFIFVMYRLSIAHKKYKTQEGIIKILTFVLLNLPTPVEEQISRLTYIFLPMIFITFVFTVISDHQIYFKISLLVVNMLVTVAFAILSIIITKNIFEANHPIIYAISIICESLQLATYII